MTAQRPSLSTAVARGQVPLHRASPGGGCARAASAAARVWRLGRALRGACRLRGAQVRVAEPASLGSVCMWGPSLACSEGCGALMLGHSWHSCAEGARWACFMHCHCREPLRVMVGRNARCTCAVGAHCERCCKPSGKHIPPERLKSKPELMPQAAFPKPCPAGRG